MVKEPFDGPLLTKPIPWKRVGLNRPVSFAAHFRKTNGFFKESVLFPDA